MKVLKKILLFTAVTLLLGNLSVTKVFATDDTIPKDSASPITNTKNAIDDWMPDKNLQSAVANALNKKISEISQEDLQGLDNLVANGLGINSLKGLEYATNLTSLDIDNNHIVDFSNLKKIRPLREMTAHNQSFVLSPVEIDGESYTQSKANLPSFIGPFGDPITGNSPYPQNGEKVVEDQNGFIWSNLNQKGTFVLKYETAYAFPKLFGISWKITQEYKRNVMAQPITVRYIDTEGNKISDDIVIKGNVDEDYTTEEKVIPGY
ncbi:hypothetical protein D2A91_14025, partial [Enterococcus faecalis]|nr:hypothetical protein [Enterococcus faecalis]